MTYSIKVAFTGIIYQEGNNTLEVQVDRSIEPGSKDFIYVPSTKWDEKFPWAKGRKDEIVKNILMNLKDADGYEIHEY